jgi:hypothetical protein
MSACQQTPSIPLHAAWGRRAYSVFAEVSRWSLNGRISGDEDMVRLVPIGVLRRLEARGCVVLPCNAFPSIPPNALINLFNAAIEAGEIR